MSELWSKFVSKLHNQTHEINQCIELNNARLDMEQSELPKLFQLVATTRARDIISCVYCAIELPRAIMRDNHIHICREQYLSNSDEPPYKRQKTMKEDDELEKDETPIYHSYERCVYLPDQHPGSKPPMSQFGFSLVLSNKPETHYRICSYSHLVSPTQREYILNEIARDVGGLSDSNPLKDGVCTGCFKKKPIHVTLEAGTSDEILHTLDFCSIQCLPHLLEAYKNPSAWRKQVKHWKNTSTTTSMPPKEI